jgi:hypothetical protein
MKNRVRPCKCGHPKSIHARMYFKMSPTNLPKSCNFPGCKCKDYRPVPAEPAASTSAQ